MAPVLQFDGVECLQELEEEDISGVLGVAADNAAAARAAARAVWQEALQQQPHITDQVRQLLQQVEGHMEPELL